MKKHQKKAKKNHFTIPQQHRVLSYFLVANKWVKVDFATNNLINVYMCVKSEAVT